MAIKGILEINDILNEYSQDIQDGIKQSALDVSKESVSTLKQTSPKMTGAYRKGWRVKKEVGRNSITCIIHNDKHYRLTHLLEKGHMKRNGGKVAPRIHIKPVEETANRTYEKQVENVIRHGG